MVFASYKELNESYTFKEILLKPYKSNFIIYIIKEVGAHGIRINWRLMKNIEVNNKHKSKYGRLKNILSIWTFKGKILPDGILTKKNSRLCTHGGMKK